MAQKFVDRLLTVAITATLTSAAWIVAGSFYFGDRDTSGVGIPARKSVTVTKLPQPERAPVNEPSMAENSGLGGGVRLLVPVLDVSPGQLRDTFADKRGNGARLHEALDIPAPAGTPVVAAGPGMIERIFVSEDGGNTLYIRSADRRIIYYYAHLSEYASGLREGQNVARGQRLGSVGSSGNASPAAPHLHFAILRTRADAKWWEPASAINPFPLLRGT